MDKIKVGIIGLGKRGRGNTKRIINFSDVSIVALCDNFLDRVDDMSEFLENEGHKDIFKTTSYKEILELKSVDVVFVFSSWESHIEIATAAM